MPIQSKQDLKAYLDADRIALKRKGKRPEFKDLIWKFQICMRKREYIKIVNQGYFGIAMKRFFLLNTGS